MSISSRAVKNGNYLSVLSHLTTLSAVNLYILEETYILLESLFHTEVNGPCPNSVY